jgi:hypothetical protein
VTDDRFVNAIVLIAVPAAPSEPTGTTVSWELRQTCRPVTAGVRGDVVGVGLGDALAPVTGSVRAAVGWLVEHPTARSRTATGHERLTG